MEASTFKNRGRVMVETAGPFKVNKHGVAYPIYAVEIETEEIDGFTDWLRVWYHDDEERAKGWRDQLNKAIVHWQKGSTE